MREPDSTLRQKLCCVLELNITLKTKRTMNTTCLGPSLLPRVAYGVIRDSLGSFLVRARARTQLADLLRRVQGPNPRTTRPQQASRFAIFFHFLTGEVLHILSRFS